MKRRLIVTILLGLFLSFTSAYSQSVNGTGIKKVSVVAPPEGLECLNTYLSFCDTLWAAMSAGITNCNTMFANDPDANIECNTFATDLYFNMHGVADAMYDRCKLNETNP